MSNLWAQIGFANPWLLVGLLTLPLLWWLLRVVPPPPRPLVFPGVGLLVGLRDAAQVSRTTPWWLLLLRCAIVALLILAFAGPKLNPQAALPGQGPLWVLLDGGWADAPEWRERQAMAQSLIQRAGREGRRVLLWQLADPMAQADPVSAADAQARLATLRPLPWPPLRAIPSQLEAPGVIFWLHDGLEHDGTAAFEAQLAALAPLTLIGPSRPLLALLPPKPEATGLSLTLLRDQPGNGQTEVTIHARHEGGEAPVLRQTLDFGPDLRTTTLVTLPPALRQRVSRISLDQGHAAATQLTGANWQRPLVGLVGDGGAAAGLELLSADHYLRVALGPLAELREAEVEPLLEADVDVLILADSPRLAEALETRVLRFIEDGGVLLRFAGPRLAEGQAPDDPLLPVRLRAGGRAMGGAMSWTRPQPLAPMEAQGIFAGLPVPADVTITRQVLAEPGPELAGRVWAQLVDGTPLVTGRALGAGYLVLVHTSANAEWSTLPISGLFPQMLERILALASRTSTTEVGANTAPWQPRRLIDGFGAVGPAPADAPLVADADLAKGRAAPGMAPGLYERAGDSRALSVLASEDVLVPRSAAASGVNRLRLNDGATETDLAPWLLVAALLLMGLDVLILLAMTGRLWGRALILALVLVIWLPRPEAQAQNTEQIMAALRTTRLAFLRTTAENDRVAEAGLNGLSQALTLRTAFEPGAAVGVNPASDELSIYPLLYWPITAEQRPLPVAALTRLNRFMRHGGLLVIDYRADPVGADPRHLQRLLAGLDIPPLEVIPADHVLTRSFYLLRSFPGRWRGGDVWIAARDPAAGDNRLLARENDGVSPVVIGSSDWIGAWAVDERGQPLLPVRDARQREMALRFGVNLAIYALTGNYKADQVHVPALLQRLGR